MRKPGGAEAAPLSRRALLGATSALPVAAGRVPSSTSETVRRCEAWVALDLEIDRLTLRWGKLEAQAARKHGWLVLSTAARRALPEAEEMFQIDDALEGLSELRDAALEPLSQLPADGLDEIASKLAVAARLLQREDMRARPLVDAALKDLIFRGARCPGEGLSVGRRV